MQLDAKELRHATEGSILKAIILEYELLHPAEKGTTAFANLLGISEGTIQNCLMDNAHLGLESWIKIELETQTTLKQDYLYALRRKYDLPRGEK